MSGRLAFLAMNFPPTSSIFFLDCDEVLELLVAGEALASLLRSALLGSLERGALSPDDLLASGDALPAASGCARGLPPPDSWDGRRALGEPPEESRAPGPRLASAWLLPPLGWGARGNATLPFWSEGIFSTLIAFNVFTIPS